jgi:hypothetical protein
MTDVDHAEPPRFREDGLRTEPRHAGRVDHGSDGRILAERIDGNTPGLRLVWLKATRTAACGVRGFGHVPVPARLRILRHWGLSEVYLLDGGRLSLPRLATVADRIDAAFGDGTTARLRLDRTLIVMHPHSQRKDTDR